MKLSLLTPAKTKTYSIRRWISLFIFRVFVILSGFLGIQVIRLIILNSQDNAHQIQRYAGQRGSYKYPARFSNIASARHCWKSLSVALENARPMFTGFPPFEPLNPQNLEEINGEGVEYKNVISYRHESDLIALKKSQNKFKDLVLKGALSVPFSTRTSGIVITADAVRLPSVYLILTFLQLLESKSPVEVFLHSYSDYDENLCERVFPLFKATCRILPEYLEGAPLPRMPETNLKRRLNRFEPLFKYLSVYASSFQDVLYLDPDSLPINRPDELFITEPFLSYGLLLWPDFWASSESTKVAEMQSRDPPSAFKPEDVRTVDLGQFVISKAIHGKTLLQAIYYATYGENLYDSLFKQGEYGNRGADAIKFAAKLYKMPFYMTRRFVEAIGYPDLSVSDLNESGKESHPFRGVASLQSFPQDDFHNVNKWGQRPLFIHQNLHPGQLDSSHYIYSHNQEHHSMWEWFGAKDRIYDLKTDDIEQLVWQTLESIACQGKVSFQHWPRTARQKACFEILQHENAMNYSVSSEIQDEQAARLVF